MKNTLILWLTTGLVFLSLVSCLSSNTVRAPERKRTPAAVNLAELRPGFVSLSELDPKKRTVCAMTLNSEHEILTFQKHLSKKEFQFVELVNKPYGWLATAIEAKLSCDILIVSGHFGGSFFGERGRLPLEELERASCSEGSSGIFHDVKEVFLFGCNTLAGKNRDHRTPEQYVEVLIQDGFSRPQAEQTAAFRYSPLGGTFHNRMSQVFAGVPRIYGFTSVGPSGKTVQPFLNKYLSQKKDYAKYLDRIDRRDNKELLSVLKVSAIAQTAGVESAKNEPIPRCVFADPKVGEKTKLDLADRFLMDPKQRFVHLGEVGQYLLKNPRRGGSRGHELSLQRKWVSDQALKRDFLDVFGPGLKSYPSLRLEMLDFGLYLGWLSPEEVARVRDEALGHVFREGLTPTETEYLMSMGEAGGRFLVYDMVKDYFEGSLLPERENLIHTLFFLKPQDPTIQDKLVRVMRTAEDPWERYSVVSLFGNMEGLSASRQWDLVEVLKNDPEGDVRMIAAWAFENLRTPDPRIHEVLLNAMTNDTDPTVRSQAIWSLAAIQSPDVRIYRAMAETMAKDSSEACRRDAARFLGELDPQGIDLEQNLIDRLRADASPRVRQQAAQSLGKIRSKSGLLVSALKEAAGADADPKVRAAAEEALRVRNLK